MNTLSGSILVLAGAIMVGSAKLAQAIAFSAGWRDTPVSMCVIGSAFFVIGLVVLICGMRKDAAYMRTLSGSILVLSSSTVFGCAKIAWAITLPKIGREVPVLMLVIACTLALSGLGVLIWGMVDTRISRVEEK